MRRILTSEEIGEKLKEFRKCKGLTQLQLAGKIDVTFQQIQNYETGASRLNTDKLQAIAIALSVPVAAFFEDSGFYLATLSEEEHKVINGFRSLPSPEIRAFVCSCLTNFKDLHNP
ncbi:helix-turn-helix domain-containing protein [Geomonas azotofigens]|uniref:helix-turn-helix domain-containing protein n=1 Tax=Geomonas azotofigens TaxID=2843196 RepID=UPI001C11A6AD|nr:helix-turn-helix transcriptional regulator [Geomonas azotofigens]MBU5613914.1 helix-turn-helix domain-containing protein [Geomonas azotofigens]